MITDRHTIALRLENLQEEELLTLYRKLIRVTTGVEPAGGVEIEQTLHIVETTDSERGRILGRLLGVETDSEPWRVSPVCLHLRQTLLFRSVAGQSETCYFSESGDAIPSKYAERCLSNTSDDDPDPLVVTKEFSTIPEGWTVVSRPPVSPNTMPTKGFPILWILVCRNLAAANSILDQLASTGVTSRPMLVVFDELESVVPEHVNNIRSCHIGEAPALLAQFFARSELLINPSKRQLVRAIVSLHAAASILIKRHETTSWNHESLGLALDHAEVEWAEIFRDERRQGVRDLQLSVIAHPLQKTRLILSSEREAQVSHYLKTQLAPRIQNFVKRQAIELAKVSIDRASSIAGVGSARHHSDWSHLRAGVLMALPSLALLTPSMAVDPSRLAQAIDGPEPLDSPVSSDSTDSVGSLPDFGDGWLGALSTAVTAKVAPLFEKGRDWLGGILKEQFAGIEQRLGSIDARLGQLLGILIAGQVAVAVAAVIGAVIMIKGSLSLSQTEALIYKLLDDLEAEWTTIRQSLESLASELEGGTSQLLTDRARRLVTELDTI